MSGDVRAALLARLRELAGLAAAATPGPWTLDANEVSSVHVRGVAQGAEAPDAAYIAAHSPSVMAPVWEALEAEVERHRPTERVHPNPGGPAWTEQVWRGRRMFWRDPMGDWHVDPLPAAAPGGEG